ncbi:MAG: DUF488 family protein [Tatlockia sp.]|nr:DUF488 family protein [Tatlockia sp.]
MSIKTKRWCDPCSPTDGWRILICRYRPRGLARKDETWDAWFKQLAPSRELHAKAYGKITGVPLSWDIYCVFYFEEMKAANSQKLIAFLAKVIEAGQTLTLLCSSACKDENHCHRSLLKGMIENKLITNMNINKNHS